MEYFTECPHCQNRFKVLITNIQGEIYTTICQKCFSQFTFRIQIQQQYPQQFFKKPSSYDIVGVLLIISALLGYLMAGMFASLPSLFPEESAKNEFFDEGAYACGLSTIIFSSFTLIGGIFAFTGKHHGSIAVGGVYGVLSIGFIIGAILSIVALILFYKIKKKNESFEF